MTQDLERDVDASEQPGLTDLERDILDLERSWWKYAGAKESEIRERWDISSTRYYQQLNTLLDKPAALEHDPMLVRRLQRLRDARRRQRTYADRIGSDRLVEPHASVRDSMNASKSSSRIRTFDRCPLALIETARNAPAEMSR